MELNNKSRMENKMKKLGLLILGICMANTAWAGQVTTPNTFTANAAAVAAEVNANFAAVKTAVDDNYARVISNVKPGFNYVTFDKPNVNLTAITDLYSVTIAAPSAGFVIVRFDGDAIVSPGDRVVLSASSVSATLGVKSGNVSITNESLVSQSNPHSFSHTMVYQIAAAGNYTYYAVGQLTSAAGNTTASVYGTLTVQFYPKTI